MADILLDTQSEPATPAAGTGVLHFDSTSLLLTTKNQNGLVMPQLPFLVATCTADFTGTNVNTAQPLLPVTVDTLTVVPGTYIMRGRFHVHTTGTTSHTFGLLFGGTAVVQDIGYIAQVTNAATEVLGAISAIWINVATVSVITAALASASHHSTYVDGIVRISTGGTFIPQYQWSAAPGVAGVTLRDSYFMLLPIGAQSVEAVGAWG
jgi:hypothetical protein